MQGVLNTVEKALEEFERMDDPPFRVVSEREAVEAAFFSQCRRSETGCWIWTGRLKEGGYGIFHTLGKGFASAAHRLSYQLFVGEIPKGLFILHSCDVPSCVNPAHLRAGTQKDNIADCIARGRFRPGGLTAPKYGVKNRLAKLTDADVIDIRNSTLSPKALSAKYGIDRTNIHAIATGKTWPHVPMPLRKVRKADGRAKLTPEQVLAIRSSDASLGELAQTYGVGKPLVSMIRNGRIWKNVAASVEESA